MREIERVVHVYTHAFPVYVKDFAIRLACLSRLFGVKGAL